MGAALLITLREGIEAALIVSILLAYLRQLGRADLHPRIWWGTAIAIVISGLAGVFIFLVAGEFEGTAAATFEGLVTLAAVAVLTWMIFWMRRVGGRIRSELQHRVDLALAGGTLPLVGLAFFAVLREGIETALFLFGAERATGASSMIGAILGLAIAVVLGYLLYRGGIKLNLRTFFRVTGGLLLVVAAGLFAYSVHELQEAGYLPFLTATAYDVSGFLSDEGGLGALLRALIGYNDDPSVLELASWAGYLLVAGYFYLRPTTKLAPVDANRETPARS
jgi:high-affinity iron transporter